MTIEKIEATKRMRETREDSSSKPLEKSVNVKVNSRNKISESSEEMLNYESVLKETTNIASMAKSSDGKRIERREGQIRWDPQSQLEVTCMRCMRENKFSWK